MRLTLLSTGLLLGSTLAALAQASVAPREPLSPSRSDAAETQRRHDAAEAAWKARDARFDAAVKRVTRSICSGCTGSSAGRRSKAAVAEPVEEEQLYDPAEAPPLPDAE